MNIKSLLLGSAAALVAVTGAHAADAVVVAEPEAVEYVRVCDAYGKGFFYIPGTETCLKIGGYLRADVKGGDDVYKGGHVNQGSDPDGDGTYYMRTRATVRFDARSETELGTLRSYIETRFQYTNGSNATELPQAYIELGGFRIGVSDAIFGSWTGAAGKVINDDVINYQSGVSNQVSYTFNAGNGFSAIIAAEQGRVQGASYFDNDYRIDSYMPHVLVGAKFEQSWGAISGVAGYDSKVEEFGGKLRLDVKFTDTVSAFVMGAISPTMTMQRSALATGTAPGKAIGLSGVVCPPRFRARQLSMHRLLTNPKAPGLQQAISLMNWFPVSPSRLKSATPSSMAPVRITPSPRAATTMHGVV